MMDLLSPQLLALLQIGDSMFPTGAFAHSYGLETYVQQGLVGNAETLVRLLRVQLRHSLATGDLLICKEAAVACGRGDLARLGELDALLAAARPAAELRRAGEEIGRRLLRSGRSLAGAGTLLDDLAAEVGGGRMAGHHAIVFAALGHTLALPVEALLLAYAYTFVAGQTSAAVRLVPLGQTDALQTIKALWPEMEAAVAAALAASMADFAAFTPGLEIRAMQHQYLDGRLFIS